MTPLTDADLGAVRAVVIAEPLVTACAWCEDEKPAAERLTGNVSHGICDRHEDALRARYNLTRRGA